MIYRGDPYKAYKKNDITTSNKQELVGKLYNEASLCLKRASVDIEHKSFSSANDKIQKAERIVLTLDNCLDFSYDIANQLHSLYQYMNRKMIAANLKKDKQSLSSVSEMLSELRDTWAEAIKRYKINNSAGG